MFLWRNNRNQVFLIEKIPYLKLYVNRRNLGGKLGQQVMEQLHIENMGDLVKFSEKVLQQLLGDKSGSVTSILYYFNTIDNMVN